MTNTYSNITLKIMDSKTELEKAEELIQDFLEMMPNGLDRLEIELAKQYRFAKLQSEYAAHVAKFSHPKNSPEFIYWGNVQTEIKKL